MLDVVEEVVLDVVLRVELDVLDDVEVVLEVVVSGSVYLNSITIGTPSPYLLAERAAGTTA